MPAELKAEIVSRLESFGLSFLYYEDIDENIATRRRIYLSGDAPVCFINAGGNLLSFAGGEEMISAKNGLIFPDSPGPVSYTHLDVYKRQSQYQEGAALLLALHHIDSGVAKGSL